MELIIATTDLVSAVFIFVIIMALRTESSKKAVGSKYFYFLVLFELLGLLFDAGSYLIEGIDIGIPLAWFINFMSYNMLNLGITFFAFYSTSVISVYKKISSVYAWCAAGLLCVNFAWHLLGALNKKLFWIEDAHYHFDPWRNYVGVIPLICMIFLFGVFLANRKILGTRRFVSLSTFALFPFLASVGSLVVPGFEISYVSGAFACEILYINVQNNAINEALIREKVLGTISIHDELTGLLNRRGYEETIEKVKTQDRIGVIFCDLNELKYTNDHFGHAAGDAYIKKFADILTRLYSNTGESFRISGDEFVILFPGISLEDHEKECDKLKEEINKNTRIAAMGGAYGEGVPVLDLVSAAEQKMYKDKSDYYKEIGHDRRK